MTVHSSRDDMSELTKTNIVKVVRNISGDEVGIGIAKF
jgi:hypothetical protein